MLKGKRKFREMQKANPPPYGEGFVFMAEMERFARRGRRAGTHTGTETCPRHVSLALLVPFSNLSMLYEKTNPPPYGEGFVFMAEMERFELSRSF